jgi:phosphoglycolate phosphatase
MILKAMEEIGTSPQRTIMIGDTTYDMQMAKAAGVHAIGVAWGYHQGEALLHAGAEVVVEDYAHLTRTIADLLADAPASAA